MVEPGYGPGPECDSVSVMTEREYMGGHKGIGLSRDMVASALWVSVRVCEGVGYGGWAGHWSGQDVSVMS